MNVDGATCKKIADGTIQVFDGNNVKKSASDYCQVMSEWLSLMQEKSSATSYDSMLTEGDLLNDLIQIDGADFIDEVIPEYNYPNGSGLTLQILNTQLTHVDFLSDMWRVMAHFRIINNSELVSLGGLSSLSGANIGKQGGSGLLLQIIDNPKLESLDFMSGITTLRNNFTIKNNDSLTNFDGLSDVVVGNLPLDFSENINVVDISGLSNMRVSGDSRYSLVLDDSEQYTTKALASGEFCKYLASEGFTVRNTEGVRRYVYDYCTSDEPWLYLLHSISDAKASYQDIHVQSQLRNKVLQVTGAKVTDDVIPTINVPNNKPTWFVLTGTQLTGSFQFKGLLGATYSFIVSNNHKLTSLAGLSDLTLSGSNTFAITLNEKLESLEGLNGIAIYDSKLVSINDNVSLSDVSGLSGASMRGELRLFGNPSLLDISPLSEIDFIGSSTTYRKITLDFPEQYNVKMDITKNLCLDIKSGNTHIYDSAGTKRSYQDYCE